MTDKTARREARLAAEQAFCGFCAASGRPLLHKRDCKLVLEHGRRIGVKAEQAAS